MFVVVYRMRIRPGHEAQYARDWADVTRVAVSQFGSGGSSLFRDENGDFVAIARWRSREDRQAFFDRSDFDPVLRERQREAVLEHLPGMELDLIDDLWADLPPTPV
ncbi:MAG: antibiotic biosynthesis monooxygenase [Caulobacter sp.]|nr:antibiotic biosynthesis monooxygenase [Caulobacter sp.]